MKYIVILLLFPFLAFSQNTRPDEVRKKGASPIETKADQSTLGTTYAVVVGISDYQDPGIPDLRFADKDAEAFANFLRSPAGGSLDGDHLKVLTNIQATVAQFAIALDWLLEVTKEGDQAVIYFSGHGDVEKKTLTQPGFLLCWDAPSRVYMAGGAFNLRDVQEVVSTLSIQNKAKVVVITDACRSGTLAGQSVGGSQATAANLAKQYANEIKILSCQPNEFSIEGEQWGGGRGAFSYNLVDALYGMADANNDLSVNLKEVGRYLEDHVSTEVAPVSQNPKVVGDPTELLASVDAKLLSELRSGKTSQMQMLSPFETKGMEDDVLANVDTTTRELYRIFKTALKDRVFLYPANACAEAYYERLMAEPKMQRLHTTMTRNYAAALQDDAQQTLNAWLKTKQEVFLQDANEARLSQKVFTEMVRTYPRCLERAAELLGSKHYMYAALKARQYFFEGYLLANSNLNPNTELGGQALVLFRQSLAWQPNQPQVYWQMSLVFGYNFLQPDSLEHYTRRALELHPNWTTPCLNAAYWLSFQYRQQDRARPFLEQASRIDSNSAEVLQGWAIFNWGKKNYTESEQQLKKAIAIDSTVATAWSNLGYLHLITRRYDEAESSLKRALELDSTHISVLGNLGAVYNMTSRFAEAEPVWKKAIAIDSTNLQSWVNLSYLYQIMGRYSEAEPVLIKAISLDSTNSSSWKNLGDLYESNRRYTEAEEAIKKAIMLDSTNTFAWNNLGALYINTGRSAEAETIFKKAIALDSTETSAWNNLGYVYLNTERYAESEPVLKKAISLDSTNANPRKHLGMVCFKTKRPEEARQNFLKAIALNPNYVNAMLGMAYLLADEGKTAEALGYVEQAIGKGATLEPLEKDEDLAPLQEQKEQWEALMKKYFADQMYYNLACEQNLKGELDKAFESLEQSLTNGWKNYDWMQQDTDLAKLREQANRWKALMKKHFPDKIKE